MLQSENIAQIAAALAAAQGEFPPIPRDKTVTVKTRTGGSYTFAYAPLDTILGAVRPALAKAGLALTQAVVTDANNTDNLRTILLHASGEFLANDTPIYNGGGDNASQAYGSGLTYARRYGITALLCIAADEDDDGNGPGDDFERVSRGNGNEQAPRTAPKERKTKSARQDGDPGIFLGDSQKRVLIAKAKGAGLEHEEGTDAALVNRYNRIDGANVNDVLADLRALTERRGNEQAEPQS
jgi:hypothetical protein